MSLQTRILFPSVSINGTKASRRLAGKTIVITGASFGIGAALARHLFHYEVSLILVARTTEKLLAIKDESRSYAAKVTTIYCDFYNKESISKLCDSLKAIHIDFFVSNAGKSVMRSIEESISRPDDYHRTMAVNYLAPVQLITTLLESFREAHTHIVNVSTYNVLMKTPPMWSAYVSSKKAMHSWIEGNIPELASMNITVSSIYLPLVESRMKDANKNYVHTPAMPMNTAVLIIIKGILHKHYHFTPWWHLPFQIIMFLGSPLWNLYWYRHLREEK